MCLCFLHLFTDGHIREMKINIRNVGMEICINDDYMKTEYNSVCKRNC